MKIGETPMRATALRAWDKTAGPWLYTWISDNGLYQVWEGRKVGDHALPDRACRVFLLPTAQQDSCLIDP